MRYYHPPKPNPFSPKEGAKLITLDVVTAKHLSREVALTDDDRRSILTFDSQANMNRSIAWFRYIGDIKRHDMAAVRYYHELRSEILDFSFQVYNDAVSADIVAKHQSKIMNLLYLYVCHLYLLYTFHYLTDETYDEKLDFESIRLLPQLLSDDEKDIMWSYSFDLMFHHSAKSFSNWFQSYLFTLQGEMKHNLITIGDFTLTNLKRRVTKRVNQLFNQAVTSPATVFSFL